MLATLLESKNNLFLLDESSHVHGKYRGILFDQSNYERPKFEPSPLKVTRYIEQYADEKFVAFPFNNKVDENVCVKMINLVNKPAYKMPYYAVAPDGYVPNSKLREIYPVYHPSLIVKPKKLVYNADDNALIESILQKQLNINKIKDAKKKMVTRKKGQKKKRNYTIDDEDVVGLQHEVTEMFDIEATNFDKAADDDEVKTVSRKAIRKREQSHSTKAIKLNLIKKAVKPVPVEEHERVSTLTEVTVAVDTEKKVDIDILEKIDKHLTEQEKGDLIQNLKVRERIMQDRSYKMSDDELHEWLTKLTKVFGTRKKMYEHIRDALCRVTESRKAIQSQFPTREIRLAFMNTIVDPHHLFKYLSVFHTDKGELLNDLRELSLNSNHDMMKEFIKLTGERYIMTEFLKEFLKTKQYVSRVLEKPIPSEKKRFDIIETCMTKGPTESVINNIFFSSSIYAKRFFQCIPECKLDELKRIITEIERIEKLQAQYEKMALKEVTIPKEEIVSVDTLELPAAVVKETVERKESVKEMTKSIEDLLPPLPVYNESSWKLVMSQYMAQMLSTVMPKGGDLENIQKQMKKEAKFQNVLQDLGTFFEKIYNLLIAFVKEPEVAQKLLEGLISEDNLAIDAFIELVGEADALNIIKTMKLKQMKVFEKVIEMIETDGNIEDAKEQMKHIMQYLPPSLQKYVNKLGYTDQAVEVVEEHMKTMTQQQKEHKQHKSQKLKQSKVEVSEDVIQTLSTTIDETLTTEIKGHYKDEIQLESTFVETETTVKTKTTLLEPATVTQIELSKSREQSALTEEPDKVFDIDSASQEEEYEMSVSDMSLNKAIQNNLMNFAKDISNDIFKTEVDRLLNLYKDELHPTLNFVEAIDVLLDLIDKGEEDDPYHVTVLEMIHKPKALSEKTIKDTVDKLITKTHDLLQFDKKSRLTSVQFDEDTEKRQLPSLETRTTDHVSNLEESLFDSLKKHKQVEKIIEVLNTLDKEKAEFLKKKMQQKQDEMALFVPEMKAHFEMCDELGVVKFIPTQNTALDPEAIERDKNEEKFRNQIMYIPHMPRDVMARKDEKQVEPYWESMGIFSNIKYQPTSKFHRSSLLSELSSTWLADKSLGTEKATAVSYEPEISDFSVSSIEEFEPIPNLKAKLRFLLKNPIYETKVLDDPVYKAEYIDLQTNDALGFNIHDQVHKIRKFKIPIRRKNIRQPTNPYNDFHILYGRNSYYLPFISPKTFQNILQKKEKPPNYGKWLQPLKTSNNVKNMQCSMKNMITGFGTENKKVTDMFKNAKFLTRHSDITLEDWVQVGAPGMSCNMLVEPQGNRFKKYNFDKYGLSNCKIEERQHMVNFISSSNYATLSDNVKKRLQAAQIMKRHYNPIEMESVLSY